MINITFLLEIDNLNRVRVTLLPVAIKPEGSIELGFLSNLKQAMIIVEAQNAAEQRVGA